MMNPASRKSLLCLALVLISAPAFSAPPQMGANYNYGGWTVTNGVIDTTASCNSAGVTSCTELVADNGFLQEEVRLDNGQKYIRLIMTEPGVTGDPSLSGASANLEFANEGFTTYLTNSECNAVAGTLPNTFQDCQGVAIKQDIRDLAAGFETTAVVQRDFAKSNETPSLPDMFNIKLSQTIDTIDATTGLGFQTGFDYTQYTYWECQISGNCNNNLQIGKSVAQSSTVYLDPFDATKKQEFRQIDANGWAGRQNGFFQSTPVVDTAGATESVTLGGRTVNGVTTGTPTTFNWNSGSGFFKTANAIKSTWVASNVVDGFDYQNFTLNGNSANQVLLDPAGQNGDLIDPFAWTPSMGVQPTF